MLDLKDFSVGKEDNRTWWICPTCKNMSAFISIQPNKCEYCGYPLPLLNVLKNELDSRIVFHFLG